MFSTGMDDTLLVRIVFKLAAIQLTDRSIITKAYSYDLT